LYGGIDKETQEKVPFFKKVHDYINLKWGEINTHNCVYTNIYRRKLLFDNYDDLNRNKLFNYLIQAYETESNIKKILSIQDYLYNKKTKLVLYGYDSFLFDFSNQDGVGILKHIKSILEEKNHFTKSKMGLNYGEMKEITNRL
jgi:predicted nucleic-acid-binding Zn-ribbon protein